MPAPARLSSALLLFCPLLMILSAQVSHSSTISRVHEAIVLEGASVPSLTGALVSALVAFRYDSGWVQIPVQVDEMAVFDFGTIYGSTPSGFTVHTYADSAMFTGADPDALFDADDELVFLAGEAGARAPGAPEPEHALPGTGVEIELTDPTTLDRGYVYLFESDGVPDPGAGAVPIPYVFQLDSGPYRTTYNTTSGPNPENSYVATSAYSVHFSDRWIRDETAVLEGGATGVDILDRHKNLFGPGNCIRSEETFSNGEGAFIVNRAGPVRALRGYVGANSGPTTHRIHVFYERREEIRTVLRVHAIPGVMDYFDYSPAAALMTYANDLNPAGVTVDGSPDVVVPGELSWEMLTGGQGTLAMAGRIVTDIPAFTYTSYYSDDVSPPFTQCTGDDHEYGASGLWVDQAIPNTDPALGAHYVFESTRSVAYGPPDLTTDFAESLTDEVDNPLLVETDAYVPTGLAEEQEGERPEFGLRFAPNPASGFTRAHLSVTDPGPVTLELFDVAGRLTAAFEADPATDERMTLDLRDLSAGVYMCRATLGSDTVTEKLVLLR